MRVPSRLVLRFPSTLMLCLGLVVLAMSGISLAIALQAGDSAAKQSAQEQFAQSSALVKTQLDRLLDETRELVKLGTALPQVASPLPGDGLAHPARALLESLLATNEDLYAVYLAWPNGDYLQIINAESAPAVRSLQAAPPATRFIVQAITGQGAGRVARWSFLDGNGRRLGGRSAAKPGFDPRASDWYQGAVSVEGLFLSTPYVFSSIQSPGITVTQARKDRRVVFGADLTLTSLANYVATLQLSENGILLVYDPKGHLIASSAKAGEVLGEAQPMLELPSPSAKALLASARLGRKQLPERLSQLLCTVTGWQAGASGDVVLLMAAPLTDFFGPFYIVRFNLLLFSGISLVLLLPLTWLLSHRLSTMLSAMAADADRIGQFDFNPTPIQHSMIHEFNRLSAGFNLMKETIASRSEDLAITLHKLKTLVDLGGKLSSLHNIEELCEAILRGAMDLTHAEGGSLYLRGKSKENRDKLEFRIVLNEKLKGFDQGGTTGKPITLPPVPLYDAEGRPNDHNVVSDAFHKDKTINIIDAYDYEGHDLSGTKKFDQLTGYHSESFLTVPLKPLGEEVIGALQLINARDPKSNAVIPFRPNIEDLIQALAAQAATALRNQDLIHTQRELFDHLTMLIAGAIDAKSPYTGGHNKRVPIIADMLAQAAHAQSEGSLSGFRFKDAEHARLFRVAAELHDCGKVTTPEYVVDKATKLETIYDRIHEIRTRFEVLLRDARIEHHERLLAGEKKPKLDAWLAERERELQEEFAFVAECNTGGEFMAPEKIERLKQIAERSWVRHFDDSLGISWEESNRYPAEERLPPPVTEKLLADKAVHRIPHNPRDLAIYQEFTKATGIVFKDETPELKYNRGELYNLSIQRGTLTFEERKKINEHIRQTMVMISQLQEVDETMHLVMEWAGSHHETLIGTGYPRRLGSAELSLEARIMAIADIFEALTARDRPYKKAKPLSEAIRILANFKRDGHIDPDLFDLFLTSGIYRRYAEEHLEPEQLDEVDISVYLGPLEKGKA